MPPLGTSADVVHPAGTGITLPWASLCVLQLSKPSATYRKVFTALEEQANLAWHVLQVRWDRACAASSRELCT
jgi:hypothetical protein